MKAINGICLGGKHTEIEKQHQIIGEEAHSRMQKRNVKVIDMQTPLSVSIIARGRRSKCMYFRTEFIRFMITVIAAMIFKQTMEASKAGD